MANDNDLIRRGDLKDLLLKRSFFPAIVAAALEEIPAVNAVEVVRCKDCIHYNYDIRRLEKRCDHPELDFDIECYDHWINTKPDDFCSHGERREGK